MKNSFVLFILLITLQSQSQILFSKKTIDLGEVNQSNNRITDIIITNKGDKKTVILRSDFSKEFKILYSSASRSIFPDSSITLRVRFDPRKDGSFKIKNEIWFSTESKPTSLTFKGDVTYIYNSYNTPCPDFNSSPSKRNDTNDTSVLIIDKNTKEPIQGSRLRIIEHGVVQKTTQTNRKGIINLNKIPISYYYLVADMTSYYPADTALYINRMTNQIILELEPMEDLAIENSVRNIEIKEEEEINVQEIPLREENPKEDPINIDSLPKNEDKPTEDKSEDLPESLYAKNNIVFLIDVSQSMNQKGKMELLKSSMLSLVDILREGDEITIITYASNPTIILPTTSGIDKEKTKKIIMGLTPGGATSGSKGFKMAYQEVIKNLIIDGNNQVIVATDGAFKEEDNAKIKKLVKKHKSKNIKTSVVGIKSNSKTSEKLQKLSQLGEGSFIYIEDFDLSKKVLIEEVKKQSKYN